MKKIINYFGGEKRFYIIMIVLIIMWVGVMALFYLKADEVTNSPCSVCAKKLQEEVVCSIRGQGKIVRRVFYPNLTTKDFFEGILP